MVSTIISAIIAGLIIGPSRASPSRVARTSAS